MYRRKHNWCIFKDGHREKIIAYEFSGIQEINFETKSGIYRYVESLVEPRSVQLLPRRYFLRLFKRSKYDKVLDKSVDTYRYYPVKSIERIELLIARV